MHRVKTRLRWPITGPSGPPPVYATWNPADKGTNTTLSNANLTATFSGQSLVRSTISKSSGKWYWECLIGTLGSSSIVGIAQATANNNGFVGAGTDSWGYYSDGANPFKITNSTVVAYGSAYNVGDVIGVALDMDLGVVIFFKNGVTQGVAYTLLTGPMFAAVGSAAAGQVTTVNFGATPFAYTVPSGFNSGLYS